jgi:high-affinity Fe2+/Pb2+ permease
LILYLVLVVVTTFWPAQKNLGELIALSAALLVASQFWYVVEGGTLVILYLPLVLLMMFRPTLVTKRPVVRATQAARAAPSLHPVR